MKYFKPFICLFCLLSVFALGFTRNNVYPLKPPGFVSDTTSFEPNRAEGWWTLSVYLNQETPDSVDFELILEQRNKIQWTDEQFIGTITNANFIPKTSQQLTYKLLHNNLWEMKIDTTGNCFFNLTNGYAPPGDSVFVVPVKVRYRNK